MQQVDDPPYLSVGTEVSAKYKGAFCEAKVRKVVRNIKCKVAYKHGGSGTVSDEQIKSDLLRVGGMVEVKHPDRKELVEATITKIQDCSQYTVVFDDGDITTLRRSALCLKSGRHFNESETLDQLPLTHPEHFGNPVIGGRRGRRSRHMPDDSSDDDEETVTTKQRIIEKEEHIGKVVCVENTETKKKSSKENWFPALVVAPTDTVRIRVKDEYLVRSFKDGRYYTVPKKEATDFTKDKASKQDSDAIQAALEYMHKNNLPAHWDRDVLFGLGNCSSDFEGDYESDTSDDEPREEKDHFVAQLYKYMDDRGTPLNKGPSITNKDVDLYRLFRAVQKLGGYNRVTTQSQWKQIATRLGYTPTTTSIQNLVKQAYKKFLLPFEEFDRKLGCTMVAHPRANRIKGRNLVRAHSVASPKPEKDVKPTVAAATTTTTTTTATTTTEESEGSIEPVVEKRRKLSTSSSGKVKALVEKYEEKFKEEAKEIKTEIVEVKEEPKPKEKESKKTTSREQKESIKEMKQKEALTEVKVEKNMESVASTSTKKVKEETNPAPTIPPVPATIPSKKEKGTKRQQVSNDEKKQSKKRKADAEPEKTTEKPEKVEAVADFPVEVGDKLKVYYHEQKVTYEAKVIEISVQQGVCLYLVHYTGWNTRYDEWVPRERIAENLTNSKTIKRSKTGNSRTSSTNSDKTPHMQIAPVKQGIRKGRGGSRGDSQPPRSTTPSSIASNSSRTKSPAITAQRRTTRAQPNAIRRTSNNTDISSVQTDDSDSDSDEPVKKPSTRKIPFQRSSQTQSTSIPSSSSSSGANKPVSNTSSEEESAVVSNKGRDFDLNQIRSELKGFKEMKSPTSEIEIETESASEKKFECPSTTSNTESGDSILQDTAKTETSDLSSESDSYGDDDSQFSDRTTTLENISESLQEKFKSGKLDTDVFKKAVPEQSEFVEKMAVLKASGIEKIIKNSLADRSKALPEKMTMKALCERSPLKQKERIKEKEEKPPVEIKTPSKSLNEIKLVPSVERSIAAKPEKVVAVEKSPFKSAFEREKAVPTKSIFEKSTQPLPTTTTDCFLIRSSALNDFIVIENAPLPTATVTTQATPQSSASDIYEFKEPEPFEFEAVKKLSPEVDKKTKKKPLTDLAVDSKPFPTSTTVTTPVKKTKKSPSKDLEPKAKPQIKLQDDTVTISPITSPPATLVPPKVDSIFDSLRKSPSFNISSSNASMSDELYVTSSVIEPPKAETPPSVVKSTFVPSMFDVSSSIETAKIFDVKPGILEKEDDDNDKPVELETAKKILLADEVFELDPPKIDKPSSIADKVLKALNQKQQQQQRQDQDENVEETTETKPTVCEIEKVSAASPASISEVKLETVVEASLIFEPPKIELPASIKKEPEVQPKKPVLSSPEHKLDILESIAPKNNDLSETIQKLELVIQHSADMGQMSDDSSDTDSEQKLVIEDESQSSETQNEYKTESQQLNDLNTQAITTTDRKIFENSNVDDNVSVGLQFTTNVHFAAAQQKVKSITEPTTIKSAFDIMAPYVTAIPQVQQRQVEAPQIKEEPDEDQTSTIETTRNESLQLLLCEETIPGSPAPPAREVFTHSMDTDTNNVPMEIDDPKAIKSDNVSLNSSRHDSLSHDDSSEDVRKNDQDDMTSRRRRRVRKQSESEAPVTSIKRRKAASRRNTGSDSEDNTENVQRFPERPTKQSQYNFLVQLDSALNSHQRIVILNKQIDELRNTYNMIKTELASIDRRRKKLRRRERENKKQQQLKMQQSAS
ncbi:AT-rich interactive domain-containing protein 4B [Pseudolycoriella hygida]|uniref:AT-rich interactive domain-containing protein 4B n=1 Tax=Pseudolycoriella hygida TaxID=35572 RepID=A0A9Q0RXP4_9DIPT|nr:AT-rich interactive domain-containing protein 4B [Pseudolycoriella hygida]